MVCVPSHRIAFTVEPEGVIKKISMFDPVRGGPHGYGPLHVACPGGAGGGREAPTGSLMMMGF
jgi:hypothetical protein